MITDPEEVAAARAILAEHERTTNSVAQRHPRYAERVASLEALAAERAAELRGRPESDDEYAAEMDLAEQEYLARTGHLRPSATDTVLDRHPRYAERVEALKAILAANLASGETGALKTERERLEYVANIRAAGELQERIEASQGGPLTYDYTGLVPATPRPMTVRDLQATLSGIDPDEVIYFAGANDTLETIPSTATVLAYVEGRLELGNL